MVRAYSIDLNTVNQLVLRKQHLTDDTRIDKIVQIARDIGGLHATEPLTPYLSLYARTRNFNKDHLDAELHIKRSLARIRYVRNTLYILPKDMVPMAFAATKQMVEKNSRGFAEFRGISPEDYEATSRSILDILRGKEMSIFEIKKALNTHLNVPAILNLMCDQGMLIRGRREKGWEDRNHKYSIFNEYLPDVDLTNIEESEARTSLIEYYIHSFGPVTINDIAWWTGLGKTEVRQAIGSNPGEMLHIEISGVKSNLMLMRSDWNILNNMGTSNVPVVNLLPRLDPYLMGYKERQCYLDSENYEMVFDRTGNATSTILVDGRVVGVWDYDKGDIPLVKTYLFEEMDESVHNRIRSEARKLGEFISGKEIQLRECDSMVPLPRRTAGGFMSPLRDC